MTKRLDEVFNVDELEKLTNALDRMNIEDKTEEDSDEGETDTEVVEHIQKISELERRLEDVKNTEGHETAMDEIAEKAMTAFTDLMELGTNVEERYSGRYFEAAHQFMKNAIDAKNSKISAKFKAMDLYLKKKKLDQGKVDEFDPDEAQDSGKFIMASRNDILDTLSDKNKS